MIKIEDLQHVLDRIEEQESKLLTWGDTGAYFSEDEIIEYIENVLPEEDPDEVLDELVNTVMIYGVTGSNGEEIGYRSRMAEGVHLYRNLRQWFHGKSVEEASTLVSDFRFLRRPRHYPRRDIDLEDVLPIWAERITISSLVQQALRAQVGSYHLSGFQVRSTERILEAFPLHLRRKAYSSATIVCSGTGSGKTMAFYLPALSALAAEVVKDPTPRVRILAIYPRKELLKDQFNETWQQCRELDDVVRPTANRKLRIGALFGDTPHSSWFALKEGQKYLPFGLLKCKTNDCQGELRWNRDDINAGVERLRCSLCGAMIESDEVALTRQAMERNVPDIVFTTTEMLNQQIGNPKRQHIFGIGTRYPVPLVLLDEIHTYSGNQGAHTAFLLRRWMKIANTRPHFVGLSATLADAEDFFARLTGTIRNRVRLIEPSPGEMIEEGAEYLLVLRGDPVSQTALLSTTIQTAMLTRRLLDYKRSKISRGTWGSKVFVFTDNLDVTNRLYWQLADAEGWRLQNGQLQASQPGPLAQLRNPNSDTTRIKLQTYGQDWDIAKYIGYSLDENDRAVVTRTSSQDVGVDVRAELVVATASLEVGFNDSEVGAIIQHKAPRDMASYLQRKGRAGRTRNMRPWTIVVLSEFGRDRVTYQHYEKLIDPEITLQRLPTDNSHVQRMQAAMAALDWLSFKTGANIWYVLNNPEKVVNQNILYKLLKIVSASLDSGAMQKELVGYLSQALQLEEENLNRILWQSPRSIILEFLPTLRRRLDTHWGQWDRQADKFKEWAEVNRTWRSPVPEFIPDNLFSDLNLPNLHIALERGGYTDNQGMAFFQGLKEFAPGRISKRFAIRSGWGADWLVPVEFQPSRDMHGHDVEFDIDTAFSEFCTYVTEITDSSELEPITVIQPHYVSTSRIPSVLAETSNAELKWHTEFIPNAATEMHKPPNGSLWADHLQFIKFYTHRSLTQLEVIRYATGSKAELKFRNGQKAVVNFHWRDNGKRAAIGTRLWVDAVQFEFQLEDKKLKEWLSEEDVLHTLRSGYFQDQLQKNPVFEGNKFTADWVFECFQAALALEVSCGEGTVDQAVDTVLSRKGVVPLHKIPDVLFQEHLIESDDDYSSASDEEKKEQKLKRELEERLTSSEILKVLRVLSPILTDTVLDSQEFFVWCRRVLANTLASALQSTVCTLLPDVDEKAIVADPEIDNQKITIWLVEQESGGAGLIALFQDCYAEDPLATLSAFSRSLQPSDYEQLDYDLHCLLSVIQDSSSLSTSIKVVRDATNYSERIQANRMLKQALIHNGFQYSHSFTAVLHSRILRPGSDEASDSRLLNYLNRWDALEDKLGFEVPLNIAAFILAVDCQNTVSTAQTFSNACRIQAVLWPRGSVVRQSVLSFYNPFQGSNLRTERCLAALLCRDETNTVSTNESEWLMKIHEQLEQFGKVDLLVLNDDIEVIQRTLVRLQTTPMDAFGLFFYPRISSLTRRDKFIILRVEFAEVFQ